MVPAEVTRDIPELLDCPRLLTCGDRHRGGGMLNDIQSSYLPTPCIEPVIIAVCGVTATVSVLCGNVTDVDGDYP